MKAVHARIEGFTSSVRVPFLVSGTQLACPLPPYSTLLGFLGCCAGRELAPEEVRIGFSYRFDSDNVDPVETLVRLGLDTATGRLQSVKERGIGQRGFHVGPVLDLYVVADLALRWLTHPAGVPCLGRSQDLVWIKSTRQVELSPVECGSVHGTWLPFTPDGPAGRIMRFTEYYRNDQHRRIRVPGPSSLFVAVGPNGAEVSRDNIHSIVGDDGTSEVIYLHQWTLD